MTRWRCSGTRPVRRSPSPPPPRACPVSRLVFFEAPLDAEGGDEGAVFLEELRERIAAGDRVGTLEVYMADMPPEWLEGAKRSPGWPTMLEIAPSLEPDAESLAWTQSAPRAELWRGITAPTLALVGEQTMPIMTVGRGIRGRVDAERAEPHDPGGGPPVGAAHDGARDRGVPRRLADAAGRAPRARPRRRRSGRDGDPIRVGAAVLVRTTSSGTVGGGISRSSSPSTASTALMASRPSASKSWRMVVSGGAK